VANSKYVTHDQLIKEFFLEAMKMIKEKMFRHWNQKILQNIIEEEDKKNRIQMIKAELLKRKRIPIARRIIAKYREQLDIPVARMREKNLRLLISTYHVSCF
jgi:RNA polymerase sigma-54 factor